MEKRATHFSRKLINTVLNDWKFERRGRSWNANDCVYTEWVNLPDQDKVKGREEQVNKISEHKPMFITRRNQKNKYQDEWKKNTAKPFVASRSTWSNLGERNSKAADVTEVTRLNPDTADQFIFLNGDESFSECKKSNTHVITDIYTRMRVYWSHKRKFTSSGTCLYYWRYQTLTFRHRASCILGQAFRYSPENAFYIFNQQIYFIIWYLLDRASLI